MSTIRRLMGGGATVDEPTVTEEREPSHVCESCGEEYFTNRSYDIDTCRSCGGIKVKQT